MQVQESRHEEQRSFVLVLDPGEDVTDVLSTFAKDEAIDVASFTAIGGFEQVRLGFFNLETRGFDDIDFHADQMEVLSLSGEITREQEVPKVHGHVVVGLRDGTTRGGHLLEGVVQPILIANVVELASYHGIGHHGPASGSEAVDHVHKGVSP